MLKTYEKVKDTSKRYNVNRHTFCKIKLRSFTLVELLVVIAVISLLMSILLPILNRAKESGRSVDCRSNMKQLTTAWMIYADDNNNKLCSPDTTFNDETCSTSNHWVADGPAQPDNYIGGTDQAIKDGVMWRYLNNVDVYGCKSAKGYQSQNSRPYRLRDYSISYTMNGSKSNSDISTYKALADIKRPSGKMVFIDADGGLRGAKEYWDYWLLGGFQPTAETEWSFPRNPDGVPFHIITARHSNGFNLTFADGHCKYYKCRDDRTIQLAHDMISEKEASDNNVDLDYMISIIKKD